MPSPPKRAQKRPRRAISAAAAKRNAKIAADRKRALRHIRGRLRAAAVDPQASEDLLIAAAHLFPTEVLAHPLLPLLALSSPKAWATIRLLAVSRQLEPRWRAALSSLRIAQHRRLALIALRRALPLFASQGLLPIAKQLHALLADLLAGRRTLPETSSAIVTMDTTNMPPSMSTATLCHLSEALMTPAARFRRRWPQGRRDQLHHQIAMPTWSSRHFLMMLLHLRSGSDPSLDVPQNRDPVATIEDFRWQTSAAEAVRAGKRPPSTRKHAAVRPDSHTRLSPEG
jgi:hypothetical protein